MATTKQPDGDLILRQITDPEGRGSQPAVLSCGGMYLPNRHRDEVATSSIITTPNHNEPVKVISGFRPRNLLREALLKESMN